MAEALLQPGSIVALHRRAVAKLAKAGSGDAALLYLCLAAGQTGAALPWDPARLEAAQRVLIELKLISSDTPVLPPPPQKLEADTPPDYTTQDIAMAMEGQSGFRSLVPAVEQLLGKVLSPADLKVLYTIYDFLGLPPEVILPLTGWCLEKARKKGPGRTPSLVQIRREAYKWQRAGVDTLEAADAHLRRLHRQDQRGSHILQLLFHTSRQPVAQEAAYLNDWIDKDYSDDLLLLARDRTLFQLQEFRWGYMNAILERWRKAGYTTPAQVEAGDKDHKSFYRPPAPRVSNAPTPSTGQAPVSPEDVDRMFQELAQLTPPPPEGEMP